MSAKMKPAASPRRKQSKPASPKESRQAPTSAASLLLSKLALTVEEAGWVLGLSRTTTYKLVMRGEIPSITIGERCRRVPTHLLRAYIESRPA